MIISIVLRRKQACNIGLFTATTKLMIMVAALQGIKVRASPYKVASHVLARYTRYRLITVWSPWGHIGHETIHSRIADVIAMVRQTNSDRKLGNWLIVVCTVQVEAKT